jgi:hypothetical protein
MKKIIYWVQIYPNRHLKYKSVSFHMAYLKENSKCFPF